MCICIAESLCCPPETITTLFVNQLCVCACVLSCFSRVRVFATLWTIAPQASVHGILQARILE